MSPSAPTPSVRTVGPPRGLRVGTKLDRYVLASALGRGGMGVVYRAYDPKLQREVAIKVVRADWSGRSTDARRRFLREARTMARVKHPNIVQVYDVHEAGGRLFIVMELVVGLSARQWCAKKATGWASVLEAYRAAGEGLLAAHLAGVIHRDFKPGNVLVGEDGSVRVTDFGLSRLSTQSPTQESEVVVPAVAPSMLSTITTEGVVMGTPVYMSPEQAMGALADELSDQFSFCVSLWEALYGARPFPDDDIDAARLGGPPPRPRSQVPAYVHRALARGLSPSMVDRYPSMRELLAALSGAERHRRMRWVGTGVVLGGAAAAMGVVPLVHAQERATCVEGASALKDGWTQAERRAVRAGLLGSGASFGGETWVRVEPILDGYADQWSAAWTDACALQASAVPQPAVRACLDEAATQFETEIGVMREADVGVTRGAVHGVESLPEPYDCLNVDAVTSRYPSNPDAVAEVGVVRRTLAEARSLAGAGRLGRARSLAEDARVGAEDAGWMPVVAESQFLLGDVLELEGDYPRAREALETAFELAMDQGQDELAARIARKTCWFEGVRMGRLETGLAWCDFAENLFARGRGAVTQRALLAMTRGMLLSDAGRFDDAERHLATAVELRREALGDQHPWVAAALKELGVVRRGQGRLDEGRALQEDALAMLEATLGSRHPHTSELHVSLGNLAVEAGEHERAASYYLQALSVAEAGLGSDHPQVGLILSALANARVQQGRLDDAQSIYSRSISILSAPEAGLTTSLGITLRNIGNLHRSRGHTAKARQAYTRARDTFAAVLGPEDVNVRGMQMRLDALDDA